MPETEWEIHCRLIPQFKEFWFIYSKLKNKIKDEQKKVKNLIDEVLIKT